LSAAMHGTVKGEHIARLTARSNAQDRAGAETLEGSSCPVHTQVRRTDRAERKPIETLGRRRAGFAGTAKRVRGGWAKSRLRLSPENPRRAKPKGGSCGHRAKPLFGRQGLLEGSKPRNRALSGRPGASAAGAPLGETVRGSFRAETHRIPSEMETSEG
jgi:hypothetical protein